MWKHQTLASAAELPATPACTPEQAQAWCNFVVWTPERIPAGCELLAGTLRKREPAWANRGAHRWANTME